MRAAIACLFVGMAACKSGKDAGAKKTATVVVAARDLAAGHEIAMLDLSRGQLPAECATPAVLSGDQLSKVMGQSLVHGLPKGEPVRVQDVTRDLACHHGPMVPVVAATKDIQRGEVLGESNLSERVIPEEHATRSVIRIIADPTDENLAEQLELWKKRVHGKKLREKKLRAGDILRVSDFEVE